MRIEKLSNKQKLILQWAHREQGQKYDNIICDGAVRSGKTICMIIGFIMWSMRFFDKSTFAICGKTVGSVERNIITPLFGIEDITDIYKIKYSRSNHKLSVVCGERSNDYYVFGGKDESSYMLIQGITLSGVLFDEVALMPESFVDQAAARTLSVKNAKLWFNCNPDSPYHWFKTEWVDDSDGKNKKRTLHLHFDMTDNPILSDDEINRAKSLYAGVFYRRYILGLWCVAEGVVYDCFLEDENVIETAPALEYELYGEKREKSGLWYVSIDYGTHNPFSAGLWFVPDGESVCYRVDEYYYSSKESGVQMTDDEYYNALDKFIGKRNIEQIVIDPSAASFIALIRKKGKYRVRSAVNDVNDGIRFTASLIKQKKLFFDKRCKAIIKEFGSYLWDDKYLAGDKVIKEHDHAMDDMRYFCYSILRHDERFNPSVMQNRIKSETENIAIFDWG